MRGAPVRGAPVRGVPVPKVVLAGEAAMRVEVDAEVCGGHGVCVVLCPEMFELVDDGYAHVITGDVPAGLQDDVRQAAGQCPTGAIRISD